jgi:hypothetical protein
VLAMRIMKTRPFDWAAVAQNEWVKTQAIAPKVAAKQWNERVKSAR